MTKVGYEQIPVKYKNADFTKKKAATEQAAAAAPAQKASLGAKFESMVELV